MITRDLVIIGGGSAGMVAAISAFDNGINDILILERTDKLGGILNQCVHDGFGLTEYKEALTGPEFLSRLVDEVKKRNIDYKLSTYVDRVDKNKEVTFINSVDGSVTIKAKAVILATGCYERSAGAIGLPGDRPTGVMTAGQAQILLNQKGYLLGKKVFILGSGDIGLIMARRFTLEGAKVLGVAELMPYSNGLNRNIVQCLQDFNIPLYLSHTVTNVIGKSKLEKIEISQVDENLVPIKGTEKIFDVDALLLSVGLLPYNACISEANPKWGSNKGAMVDQNYQTSLEGIFSCGNCLHVHDLVDLVVEESRETGKFAAHYIQGKLPHHYEFIQAKAGNGIGYLKPEIIDVENIENDVCVKFRVRKPIKNVTLVFELNGKTIKEVKKNVLIPSEMVKVKLGKELFETKTGEMTLFIK